MNATIKGRDPVNKGLCASCLVIAMAAGLGYWAWSDDDQCSKTMRQRCATTEASVPPPAYDDSERIERFTTGEVRETIDLSHSFDATGEELTLKNLLDSVEPELLPLPRQLELLPAPRLAVGAAVAESAEEASTTRPSGLKELYEQVVERLAEKAAAIISELQPLKGSEALPPDTGNELEP
jgi:hypothetical protein